MRGAEVSHLRGLQPEGLLQAAKQSNGHRDAWTKCGGGEGLLAVRAEALLGSAPEDVEEVHALQEPGLGNGQRSTVNGQRSTVTGQRQMVNGKGKR